MSRRTTPALATALVLTALLASASLTGCMGKKAPVLTQQQLMAGVIGGEKHPVSQDQATKMSCSCHAEAAKKAGQ
jgi:hypothetical protein